MANLVAGPAALVLLVLILQVEAQGYGSGGGSPGWTDAHATFYGGGDASGTMGTFCPEFTMRVLLFSSFCSV
ncbi:hypothetical protein O6H91_04G120700 [Diphasiastrum complanatum]|uniref:Uncharacterized protein n=1 Tax=Diphasiastrum complanatum TaxID=34168 RepID=A0ACC2E187_DIPCM|nr:hypothetical protein O6H91_04G120700 [Diphasiastrum complanatum]